MTPADPKLLQLDAAWQKFSRRIAEIRTKTRLLMRSADTQTRESELESLRKRIQHS